MIRKFLIPLFFFAALLAGKRSMAALKDTIVFIHQPFNDTILCPNSTFNVGYLVNYKFQSGNTFTAQLSNASGSFSSPVNIGTVTNDTAGTISCTLPMGTPAGSGYRIRIIATSPIDTSNDNYKDIHVRLSLPAPNIIFSSPICEGDSLLLSATDSIPGVSFSWSGPNSFTDTLSNTFRINTALTDSGKYYVSVSLHSCTGTDSVNVVIHHLPAKPVAGSSNPCQNAVLSLSASTGTSGVTYHWTGPNAFIDSAQNPFITNAQVSDSGDYVVTVTLNGCSASDTIHAQVHPFAIPQVTISSNPYPIVPGQQATFTATVINGGSSPTFQWYKNTVPIPGAISNPDTATLNGREDMSVIVHSNAECLLRNTCLSNVIIAPPLRVAELIGYEDNWAMWPNPFTDQLTIESDVLTNYPINLLTYRLGIFNVFGQLLSETIITENETRINTTDFPAGLYLLQITDNKGNGISKKITKE